jgi:hypothetical protein
MLGHKKRNVEVKLEEERFKKEISLVWAIAVDAEAY